MTGDRGGAAAILAVFSALADLDGPGAVAAELCLAENMPSGDAQRPADVITIRGGTTVEVLNTDAEGRLVMADGQALAAEDDDVDAIVDVATLTGAVKRAIGARATGIFSNDDDLLRQLLTAAEDAGEAMWHLPLWEDLRDNLESDVADLDHLGTGAPSAPCCGGSRPPAPDHPDRHPSGQAVSRISPNTIGGRLPTASVTRAATCVPSSWIWSTRRPAPSIEYRRDPTVWPMLPPMVSIHRRPASSKCPMTMSQCDQRTVCWFGGLSMKFWPMLANECLDQVPLSLGRLRQRMSPSRGTTSWSSMSCNQKGRSRSPFPWLARRFRSA
jgi:hypothetical protein